MNKKLQQIIEKACPEFTNQDMGIAEVLRTVEMFSEKAVLMASDGRIGEIAEISSNGFSGKTQWDLQKTLHEQKSDVTDYLLSLFPIT